MAKRRYTGKKKRKKGGRASSGRRLARYNALAKRIGKSAAHAQVFGGKRARKGAKKAKRGRRGGHNHRSGGGRSFRMIVEQVQRGEGTLGWPPTADEVRKAEQIADAYNFQKSGPSVSPEDRIRREAASNIDRVKRAAAARLVASKIEERRRQERKSAEEAARKDIENEAARL